MAARLRFVAVPSRSQVHSCVSASAQLSIFYIPPVISSRLRAFSSYTPPPKRSLTSCVAALKLRSQAACFSHDNFSRAYRRRSVSKPRQLSIFIGLPAPYWWLSVVILGGRRRERGGFFHQRCKMYCSDCIWMFATAAILYRSALKIGLQFVTRAVYWSHGVRPVIMCRSLGHLVQSNTADIHTLLLGKVWSSGCQLVSAAGLRVGLSTFQKSFRSAVFTCCWCRR